MSIASSSLMARPLVNRIYSNLSMKTNKLLLAISFVLNLTLEAQQSDLTLMTPKQRGEYFTRTGMVNNVTTPVVGRKALEQPKDTPKRQIKINELDSVSTGVATSDSYRLGLSKEGSTAKFFVTVSIAGGGDLYYATSLTNGEEQRIIAKGSRKEGQQESFWLSIELPRKQIETANVSGIAVSIVNGGSEKYAFRIPKCELEKLLQVAAPVAGQPIGVKLDLPIE